MAKNYRTLTVHVASEIIQSDRSLVRVYWFISKNRRSAVDVSLPASCSDKQAVAELVAIRYLLDSCLAFNNKTTSGAGLSLVVSKGAIKKLARNSTQKVGLYEFGYPLLTKYAEATISVSKDSSWFPDQEDGSVEIPLLDAESYRGMELVETSDGIVGITQHALERYSEYCNTINLSTAWKNLTRRLKGSFDKVKLPANVLAHKRNKYGLDPEIWKNEDNPLNFVFCEKGGHKVLVTVFNRSQDNGLDIFRPDYANSDK